MRASLLSAVTAVFLLTPAISLAATPVTFEAADMGSITVDATIIHDATPDEVYLNVSCDNATAMSRSELRAWFKKKGEDLKNVLAGMGEIRRSGAPFMSPSYDPLTGQIVTVNPLFTGSVYFRIEAEDPKNFMTIADNMQEAGCNPTWDARLDSTAKYGRKMQEELMSQITDKKEFYESILGKKLTKVSGLLLTTAVNNGYSSVVGYGGGYYGGGGLAGNYDPETNMMEAITTLSITFDTGKAVAK